MGERPKQKRLSDLGELRPQLERQKQMQASSGPKDELDAKGMGNVAYALKEFADSRTKYGSAREAAGKIGEMLTEKERATFMADLTTAGLLEEPQQGGELNVQEVFDKLKKLGADDSGKEGSDGRMTEEELLRGLEGIVPKEAAIPPQFEQAYKKLEQLRRTGTPREDQLPLASRGSVGNDEFDRFKAFVQERDSAARRENTASTLPKKEEREPPKPYKELIPLGNTPEKLTQTLGRPKGHVEGIPYWVLEDGDGVMLSPEGEGTSVPQRFGENGIRIIKGTTYQYKAGAFHKATAEQARSGLRTPQRKTKRESVSAPAQVEPAAIVDSESPEKKRSLEESKKIFLRAINKEKKKAGKAFRQAAAGLASKDRKRLISFIADTTDIPRNVLESIDRDFEREQASEGSSAGESAPEEKQREEIRRVFRGEAAASSPESDRGWEVAARNELREMFKKARES